MHITHLYVQYWKPWRILIDKTSLILQSILSVNKTFGEVSEWSKVHDWKSCMVESHRGFESPPLRSAADTWL